MLRIDDHGLIDSPGEFDGIPAIDFVGDWWSAQIKAYNRPPWKNLRFLRMIRKAG